MFRAATIRDKRFQREATVVDRTGRRGEMKDRIDRLDMLADQRDYVRRHRDIFRDEREVRVTEQSPNVCCTAGKQVVDADDPATLQKQPFNEMRADEPGASRYNGIHAASLTGRASALRLDAQISPLSAYFLAFEAHELVDHLRPREHAGAA